MNAHRLAGRLARGPANETTRRAGTRALPLRRPATGSALVLLIVIATIALLGPEANAATISSTRPGAAAPLGVDAPHTEPSSGGAQQIPDGFPAELRQFVAGTAEFKNAPWSQACLPGGASASPHEDAATHLVNTAAKPGGVDLGLYLNALAPQLNVLEWWQQDAGGRAAWWKKHPFLTGGKYPGDAKAAALSPQPGILPSSPLLAMDEPVQYPSGYCSTEMLQWASPASDNSISIGSTAGGIAWKTALDQASIDAEQAQGTKVSAVEKTPCDSESSTWCSIAFYVDCTTAAGKGMITDEPDGSRRMDARGSCEHWNNIASENIYESSQWLKQHRSAWDKIKGFFGGVASSIEQVAASIGNFFIRVYQDVTHATAAILDFMAHPLTELDKVVNELKKSLISLIRTVLGFYNDSSTWDPLDSGFLSDYAKMAGLGIILTAFMFLGALRRAAESGSRQALNRVLRRVGITIVTILWAPLLFQIVENLASAASANFIDNYTAPKVADVTGKVAALSSVTSTIPGGVFVGLILFLVMLLGALGLFVGLQVQKFGMELGGVLIPLVMATYVHPRWRRKSEHAMWAVIGLGLAKPLAILVLGAGFSLLARVQLSGDPEQVLSGLAGLTIGLVIVGLAPFGLLKWAPILPAAADSHDHQRDSAGMVSGAVLGAASSTLARTSTSHTRSSWSTGGAGRAAPGGASSLSSSSGTGARTPTNTPTTARAAGGAGEGATGSEAAGGTATPSGTVETPMRTGGGALANGYAQKKGITSSAGAAGGPAGLGISGAAQLGQAALARGRSLARSHAPSVDLPDDEDGGRR